MTTVSSGIQIPPLWCPLELRIRPGFERFQKQSERWLARHGIDERSLRRAGATGVGFLACTWTRDGADEGCQLLTDWLQWALLFDDHYCDAGDLASHPALFNPAATLMMHRGLYPKTRPTEDPVFDAFAATLIDVMRRVHEQTDPQLAQLCVLQHYEWAVGAMCGVSDRAGNTTRTVDEHLVIRPMDAAYHVSINLIEVANRTMLPARDRVTPHVRAITQAAGILFSVCTDLASYTRERYQGCLESNVVHIIANQHQCDLQEALESSCALLEEIMGFFVAMLTQLRVNGSDELCRYLDHVADLVRGTYEWQRTLPRYTTPLDVPAHTSVLPVHADTVLHEITDIRTRTYGEPLPSIAWWWDLLD